MAVFADLAPHKPIRLTEASPSVSDSVIFSGMASAADVLRGYAQGDAEVSEQARADTAAGLLHVPVVSPEDHQAWTAAHMNGQPYEETPLGTVIEADLVNNTVPFRMVIHDQDAIRRVRSGEWPDVSVAYVADLGDTNHPEADFAQRSRKIRHLALVPRGRDPHAHIVRDAFADGAPMTLAEIKAKYPDAYKRARSALLTHRKAGYALADAFSLDKVIPVLMEMRADPIGKLVLHAIANEQEELKEIETGMEDEGAVDPAMNNQATADALASLAARVDALAAKVEPIATRTAAADAAAAESALKTRAASLAQALDNATIARPDGFDPSQPTVAACDAANDLLVRELAGNRRRYGFVTTPPGAQWDPKTGKPIVATATADAASTSITFDEL